jgi:cyanophycin synthetase
MGEANMNNTINARPLSPADTLNDIQLLRINYLRGPNMWTYRPILEVWLDLGALEAFPTDLLPGFVPRLTARLPALVEHHCGVGERGGFLQRLETGTWLGHVLEHVVIELLNLAGMPTGFGQTRSTSQSGVYRMVFRARDEQVARVALAQGHALLMATLRSQAFDVDAAVTLIRDKVDDCYLGPSTAAIVAAATDRRIPHIRLNDGNLVQLGHGANQRRIWTAQTDQTNAIASGIARDKDLTKTLLKAAGVPVPEGVVVKNADEAWEAAQDIGLPVVIKPTDGNHGRGVTLDLRTREHIAAAFALADGEGSEVLVERSIPGDEHRLLVVGGKVVAAARGETAWITGDGQHSVVQLIDSQINTDPRRGLTEDFPLNRINIDNDPVVLQDLARQGLGADTVPAVGQRVLIQRNGNVAIDCTPQVHPEVAHAVALAARVVGLDIAGIDVVAVDIGKSLQSQGGAIVEVNSGPGLLMHLKPAEGMPQPVGQAIVDHLFAPEATGRIPIVGVAGSHGTTAVARLVAWFLHLGGRHVGLACSDGLYLGNRLVERKNTLQGANRWDAAHRLLINRSVDTVVAENDATAILQDGLAYDRCLVGVVTDLDGIESLSHYDIQDEAQLFKVMRTQIDVVLPEGFAVLNADDARVLGLAELCDGQVMLYGMDSHTAAIEAHRAQGGRAVVLQRGMALLATGSTEVAVANVQSVVERLNTASTATPTEASSITAQAVLAAIATAWALGIVPELISAGLDTFAGEPTTPAPTLPQSTLHIS